MYPDLDPKMEEINRLFAQMDILQQKLIKICSRAMTFEGIYTCNRNEHASWDIRHKSAEMSTRAETFEGIYIWCCVWKPNIKELARLLSQIDTWQCSGSSEMYPDLDPKMEEINRLFAQIDI